MATVQPTHLLHLAWVTTPGVYWTSPENRRWMTASQKLLEAFAAFRGKRVVLTGSCAEYDWTAVGQCHEYRTPTTAATLYGQCKNALHESATAFARNRGLSLAWARLFFLYGPREHPARLVPSVARALLAGEPAECSAGTQSRDFLHVDDAADALVTLLLSQVTGPVNVASGEAVSIREVVEAIAAEVGRPDLPRFGARPTAPDEPSQLFADVSQLRREVGWVPRIDLKKGLADTVTWWRGRDAA
jgi:nucleoside-diphosphate-sugar epimerase